LATYDVGSNICQALVDGGVHLGLQATGTLPAVKAFVKTFAGAKKSKEMGTGGRAAAAAA